MEREKSVQDQTNLAGPEERERDAGHILKKRPFV